MDAWTVRRLGIGDEALLRTLRIAALTDAPEQFCSTLEREERRTLEDWRRWFAPGVTFVAERAGGPVGLVAGFPARDEPAAAYLLAMWVAPEHRGGGCADALIRTLLRWAQGQGYATVILDVVEGNERAQRVYARHGFRATGTTHVRSGHVEVEMRCPLGDG